MNSNNRIKGNRGENIAKEYLQSLKYEILATNYHYSNIAEIDIIAKNSDTIVFVEVKTRYNLENGHPFEAISASKVKKIYMAALNYLEENNLNGVKYRIDAISVLGRGNPEIEHIKNIGF